MAVIWAVRGRQTDRAVYLATTQFGIVFTLAEAPKRRVPDPRFSINHLGFGPAILRPSKRSYISVVGQFESREGKLFVKGSLTTKSSPRCSMTNVRSESCQAPHSAVRL